jgi:hypothetical protein
MFLSGLSLSHTLSVSLSASSLTPQHLLSALGDASRLLQRTRRFVGGPAFEAAFQDEVLAALKTVRVMERREREREEESVV